MTNKQNKPEKKEEFETIDKKPTIEELENILGDRGYGINPDGSLSVPIKENIGFNKAIDEMDAYYKQFIKDNIPGRGELYNMIWNLHIQVAEVKDIKKLTKAIRKLIKERLDV